jgi:N-terminal acetyltransferase B complex non-catalytic subunit
VFLKIYIRAFQQASDLDNTVEEKLLVGDRPKQTNDPGRPLRDRLTQRNESEEAEVSLGTWLKSSSNICCKSVDCS